MPMNADIALGRRDTALHAFIIAAIYCPTMKTANTKLLFDESSWGLPDARREAAKVLENHALVRTLLQGLSSADGRIRQRAADTARRVTERSPVLLSPYAERLLGLFSESGSDNWRTRAHLGLVVARIAGTSAQRRRAAGLLLPLYYDSSNVVRCTAIEGWGILGAREPALRTQFRPLLEEALSTGTLAMQNRARYALTERGHR